MSAHVSGRAVRALFLPILLTLTVSPAAAQFSFDIGVGPLGVHPSIPSTVYAGTGVGLFRSTNGGGAWTPVYVTPVGTSQPAITAIAIDPARPTTLYIGTRFDSGSVWKSTDGGATWQRASSGLPQSYTGPPPSPLVPPFAPVLPNWSCCPAPLPRFMLGLATRSSKPPTAAKAGVCVRPWILSPPLLQLTPAIPR